MDKKTPPRTQWVSVRLTKANIRDITGQAKRAGISRSELLRMRSANKPVVSRTDKETANSIDKLGRMLKHFYPKNKAWASAEDRRKFWRTIEELQRTAQALRGSQDEKCSPK